MPKYIDDADEAIEEAKKRNRGRAKRGASGLGREVKKRVEGKKKR